MRLNLPRVVVTAPVDLVGVNAVLIVQEVVIDEAFGGPRADNELEL